LTCLLVTANLHQINSLFIPLVLCEAYGVYSFLELLKKLKKPWAYFAASAITTIYLICLVLFQKDYYTDYKDLVNAYFAAGMEECVDYALEQCEENDITVITAEKGAQWPRLLLFTETLPSEYLRTVEYDVAPAPSTFVKDGIRINTRINYDAISQESIYIIYFTDKALFEKEFDLMQFYDWYVAVPKKNG